MTDSITRFLRHAVAKRPSPLCLIAGLLFGMLVAASSVRALAEEAPPIRIALVGDSTVTETAGWGKAFAELLTPNVRLTNCARGGQSTKSFLDQGLLATALLGHPNYVLIQFGHNDMPGKGPNRETDPNTTYRTNLIRYVDESRAAGAQPVLVSSLVRRTWNRTDGTLIDGLAPYAEAMKAVAAEKKVPLVDLHARSLVAVQNLGAKGSEDLGPMTEKGTRDGTHLSPKGAALMAGLVAEELRAAVPALVPYFKK